MFEEVGAELLSDVVKKVEEISVERAIAVGPDEIALLALEAERTLGQRVDEAVDTAGGDVFVGKEIPEFEGGAEVLAKVERLPLAHMGFVPVRAGTDDKDLQFLEVREERERHAASEGIALGLKNMRVAEDLRRFLGLTSEPLDAGSAKYVVGARLATGDGGTHLDVDLALGVNEALGVAYVPAEGTEEGVEEIGAQGGLVIVGRREFRELAVKAIDEVGQLGLELFESRRRLG